MLYGSHIPREGHVLILDMRDKRKKKKLKSTFRRINTTKEADLTKERKSQISQAAALIFFRYVSAVLWKCNTSVNKCLEA